jgi:hypothetical protein
MRITISFFFSLIITTVFSQKTIVIEGQIINEQNNSVPFASILLQESLAATTSDLEGYFKLVFSSNNLPDTLVIRHISFQTQKVFLTENPTKKDLRILLRIKENEVGTIEVVAKNAFSFIKSAISNIEKNYPSNTYYLKGFYRQKHKENGKFVRLIEATACVQEAISDRADEKQKERFFIEKIRRSNVYERNGDKHGDHLVDLMSENPINYTQTSFLNMTNIYNYDFKIVTSKKATEVKIYFQNKDWQAPQNKAGFIVINKYDYAIVSIEITSTKNPIYKTEHFSNWKFQNGTYRAEFKKEKEKYFCSESSKYYNHYVLNEHSSNIDFIVEEYFEWFTFDLSKENQSNKKYSLLGNLYSLDYKYDPIFWRLLHLPKIDEKVFSDLNSFKGLEKQFEND